MVDQIKARIPAVDHSLEGNIRTMLRIMMAFFLLSFAWSIGIEVGVFTNPDAGERMFQVGQIFLSVALGIGVGKSPLKRNGAENQ